MKIVERPVYVSCPYCYAPIPLFMVRAAVSGWWRNRVAITVDGDASDIVTHVWQHDLRREPST